MNKGPLPLHVRDSLLLNPTNYTVCCVWLFLHLQKLKLKLIFLCVEPCCSLESQSYKVRLLPLKKGRPCGYGNGGKGGMGTWTVSFVPMSLLHPWDLLSFPVLGIADGKLQLFRVNAIVRQFQVLFSKYNLGKKKCASGSFECQEGWKCDQKVTLDMGCSFWGGFIWCRVTMC